MKLCEFRYSEHEGDLGEWSLERVELADAMLLVGRNASGKSRTLGAIRALAEFIKGKRGPTSGTFEGTFRDSRGNTTVYHVKSLSQRVHHEQLWVNDEQRLVRQSDGSGTIQAVLDTGNQTLPFQIEESALAVVTKRDRKLHPFLEPLHVWADGMRFYPFGRSMGQEQFAVYVPGAPPIDSVHLSDWWRTVAVFLRGKNEIGDSFLAEIKAEMQRLDYAIENIDARQPLSIQVAGPLPGPLLGLAVQERDLGEHWVDQVSMSSGMFRALALLVHMTYARLANKPSCVLLDDVGEGLDYKRSTLLIERLLELSVGTGSQILMATNDRFVMNAVPLEHWAALLRQGGKCRLRTYQNAREKFDSFRSIGLNHFDLFRSGYLDDDDDDIPNTHDNRPL